MDINRYEPSEGFSPATPKPGRRPGRPEEDVAYRHALRLTFSYQKSQVELILMEAIHMIVPPSLEITSQPPGAAFWYELQDSKQTPLYRRVQRNPLDPSVEVLTGDPEMPLAYVNSGRIEGEFTLLVPSLPQARAVVLYQWSLPPDAVQSDVPPSPAEIARFPLGHAIGKETIARDTIPPRTVSDALAAYNGTAVIHLRANDNMGQVANTVYRLNKGEEQQGLTVTVDQPGKHTLLFWSVDRAGNVEAENRVTFTVRPPARRRRN
jgi:hypothetical protein